MNTPPELPISETLVPVASHPFQVSRRAILLAGGAVFASGLHAQPAFPSRPLRIISPFPPGGPADAIGRALVDALSQRMGQPVLLDSKVGAGGIVAASEAVRVPPDGYTLLWTLNDSLVSPVATLKTQPYNVLKDFVPITLVGAAGFVLVVRADSPLRTLADVVRQARATPDKMTYASWGQGSMPHLMMEALCREANVKLLHVPYKGLTVYLPELLGGTVDMCFIQASAIAAYEGKVRPIAALGPQRNPFVPSAPTFAESGFRHDIFKTRIWLTMLAPARTPADIQARLVQEIKAAAQAPTVLAALRANGYELVNGGPETVTAALTTELNLVPKLMREIGIEPQ